MRLSEATVAIHGLGLMGGSLGLALEGKCKRRIGIARRPEVADQALQLGAVDNATLDFQAGVSAADIVVLATPMRQIMLDVEEAGSICPRLVLWTLAAPSRSRRRHGPSPDTSGGRRTRCAAKK